MIGILLFLVISFFIYKQVDHHANLHDTLLLFQQKWSGFRKFLLVIVLLLMLLNWSIEAKKWQMLLNPIQQISFLRSLRSVFTGISVSLLTPNRIGEYAGRIIYLKNINKIKGITTNIVGSIAQFIAAAFFGILGIVYYLFFGKFYWFLVITLIASLIGFLFLLLLYYKFYLFANWLSTFGFYKKIKMYVQLVQQFDTTVLQKMVLFSALRYVVFAIQYYLLLQIFLVDISFVNALPTIFLVFWAMAIIPTITITEITTRTTTSYFFFSAFTANTIGVMAASFTLWLINLIFPALLGALLIIGAKIWVKE